MGHTMTSSLVDTNIVFDLFNRDPAWFDWSSSTLGRCRNVGEVIINPIVFAEAAADFSTVPEFMRTLEHFGFTLEHLPWAASFDAGKAHVRYRRGGGSRGRTLPDFFVGAHAAAKGYRLLTRDGRRYRKYFPDIEIIAPDTHP